LTASSTGNNNDWRQRRRIDFVLVYSLGVRDSLVNKQRRQAFQHKLQSVGFEIEEQDIVGGLVEINYLSFFLYLYLFLSKESRHDEDDENNELTTNSLFKLRRHRQRRLSSQPQQQSVKRFVRLHAPFELLLELAEKTRMKLPIEVRKTKY
jgi:hypothetical protein